MAKQYKIIDAQAKPAGEPSSKDLGHDHYLKQELERLIQTDPTMFEFFHAGVLDGIWYWDLNDVEHEWMSPRFWEVLGYDPAKKTHTVAEWQDIIFDDDLQVARRNYEKHLADPSHPYDQYVRYRHANGSTVWIRCRGMAIRDPEGNPIRFVGGHVDVTSLMSQQEQLLKERIRTNLIERELREHDVERGKLLAEVEALKHEISLLQRLDASSGLLSLESFLLLGQERWQLAARLHCPIGILSIAIANAAGIRDVYGPVELTTKLQGIADIVRNHYQDALCVQTSDEMISVLLLGYPAEEAPAIVENLTSVIELKDWSIVAPKVAAHCNVEFPNAMDVEQLQRMLVTSNQMLT